MVWWLFKKKEDVHKKIDYIHNSVQNSFINIKSDMGRLNERINLVHTHHTNNSKNFDRRLLDIEMKLAKLESYLVKEDEREEVYKEPRKEILKNEEIDIETLITDQQGVFLMRMVNLLNESSGEWIPMRALAETLYPRTKYINIKSLVSNYTDILSTWGLLKKSRKGREIILNLTDKGHKLAKRLTEKEKRLLSIK